MSYCCGKNVLVLTKHSLNCPNYRSYRHEAVLANGRDQGEGAVVNLVCNHRIPWGLWRIHGDARRPPANSRWSRYSRTGT